MANHYDVPAWAGKAPTGHHLDVTKDDKLIQKLMIDDKKCYLFGRNPHLNDFCIDHGSCSRVHAALVYHKHLNISYLVDLGSTHGTFIGNLRIEGHKPTQLQLNSTFHFGASTRYYVLRERPSAVTGGHNILEDIPLMGDGATMLGLPESQTELDNLTEYNTAHNRRISMLCIADDALIAAKSKKSRNSARRNRHVTFNEEEIIINPEDVDPSVGRFRNLVKTTVVIPNASAVAAKRQRLMNNAPHQYHQDLFAASGSALVSSLSGVQAPVSGYHLYEDLPPSLHDEHHFVMPSLPMSRAADAGAASTMLDGSSLNAKFGMMLPNPAPDVMPVTVDERPNEAPKITSDSDSESPKAKLHSSLLDDPNAIDDDSSDEPRKKKYAKEAWPGRKPLLNTF